MLGVRHARAAFLGACTAYAIVWLWSTSWLPARVPTHFVLSGSVDGWNSRRAALLSTALLGVGTAALFGGPVWLVAHSSGALVNIPNAAYWRRPQHLAQMRRLVSEDLWGFGAWTLLLLSAIQVLIVRAAGMPRPRVDPWAQLLLAVYLGGTALWILWMYRTRYAVPPDASPTVDG